MARVRQDSPEHVRMSFIWTYLLFAALLVCNLFVNSTTVGLAYPLSRGLGESSP